MEIKIIKEKVYDYASALTARAGSVSDAYSQITITKDNYPMLDVYLSEAVSQAENGLRKKLLSSNRIDMRINEDAVVINTKEQHMADTSVYALIESSLRLYIAYHIAANWLQSSPVSSLSEVYGTTATTHLQTAISAISQKEHATIHGTDYADKANDDIRMEGNTAVQMAEYSNRNGDCVIARPGIRITEKEVLTVRSEDDKDTMLPAVTLTGEHLMSNQ